MPKRKTARKAGREKKKEITLSMPAGFKMQAPLPAFKRAARRIWSAIERDHFGHKSGGWPLDYGFLVTDVFNEAMGHNLENYIFNEIMKSGKYELATEEGNLTVRKLAKKKGGPK